jgi:hypothetical protein
MLYIEYINAFVCKFKKTSMPEKSFEKILAGRIKTKKWKKKNRDLWLQSKRRYYKKKMLDPKFVLATRLRSRVRKLFKKKDCQEQIHDCFARYKCRRSSLVFECF